MCAVHSTREEPPPLQCRTTSTRVFRRACSTRWIHSFSRSQEQNDVTARLRSEKNLNMRCTCCLFMLTLWSAAAGCNNRMPMCIGSFSLHSKWIGLSKRDPNSSVLRCDVESDRLIGNPRSLKEGTETTRRMTDELGSRQRDQSTSSVN